MLTIYADSVSQEKGISTESLSGIACSATPFGVAGQTRKALQAIITFKSPKSLYYPNDLSTHLMNCGIEHEIFCHSGKVMSDGKYVRDFK